MIFSIVRQQLVPPGTDTIMGEVDDSKEDVQEALTFHATLEAQSRSDVHHISISTVDKNMWATIVGCPSGTGNRYSYSSSMVRFVVKPKEETK